MRWQIRQLVTRRLPCFDGCKASITCLRSCFYDIRTAQELPCHSDVAATMIYTHVLKVDGGGVRSPVDSAQSVALAAQGRIRAQALLRRMFGKQAGQAL